jgi:hypothetical protein
LRLSLPAGPGFSGLLGALFFAAGCAPSISPTGLDEPILVENGTFFSGRLPGSPEPDGGTIPDGGPQVPDIETSSATILQGEVSHSFTGHLSPESYSVAVSFQDAGSGYWVVPAQGPDPTDDNLLSFSFNADFSENAPLGLQSLLFSAIDGHGKAGEQQSLTVCVLPDYPDNYNACFPKRKPPAAIVSLSWNSNADLDLVVKTPDGKWVDSKHPTTAEATGGSVPDAGLAGTTLGAIDRDSNGNCVEDNFRREDASWTEPPVSGLYEVFANEFSACGAAATTFEITTYRRVADADAGTYALTVTQTIGGQFLAQQANGSDGKPLYVTSISFP